MMKGEGNKMTAVSIEDVSEGLEYSALKDFVISDGIKKDSVVSLEHPTVMTGVVFVLCLKGEGKMKINMKEYDISSNMILTVLPGSICEVISYSSAIHLEYLFFTLDFAYGISTPNEMNILEKIDQHHCVKLSDEQFNILMDFHAFILRQYKRVEHPYRKILVRNLLASFLTEVSGIYKGTGGNEYEITGRREEIFRNFGKLLLENIKNERTVQFYADKMCLSAKYLSQLIKEISGKPIMYWINEFTIVIIKAMLKTSGLSVLQISEELNFPNPSFFGRYFKKHTGITPIQYRES